MNSIRERFSRPGLSALILLILLPAVFLARPAAAEPLVYVAMFDQNAVAVIDIASNAVISTIPVGSHPGRIAVSPDGNTIYVTNLDSASVSVIDAASATVAATITVGARPWGLALAPDGSRLFVVNRDSLSVINTVSLTTEATVAVGFQNYGVAVSPDGSRIWVSHWGQDFISVIDAATLNATTLSFADLPYLPPDLADLTVSADGSRIYITCTHEGIAAVLVVDSSTGLVTNIIQIGGHYAQGIAVAPDDGHAVVAGENGIHIIDLTNFTPDYLAYNLNNVLDNGYEVAYAPDGRRAYATYRYNDDYYLLVIDAANYSLLTEIPLPGRSSGIAVAPMTALPVTIDIKPGPEVIALTPGAKGSVPVAILSTVDFSAPQQVDAASLRLAGAAVRIASNGKPLCHAEDVNFDGFNDLTCQFTSKQLTLAPGAVIAQLSGTLLPAYGSTPIWGEDAIKKYK